MVPWRFAMTEVFAVARVTVVLAAVFAMAHAGPVCAGSYNVYEVNGVAVDVTAETAAKAREKALPMGQGAAFRRLLERLTLRDDHIRLPEFTPEEVSEYVKDFSVAEEKTSAVRYLAKLNYRFRGTEVRGLLNDFELPFAETRSKPVLVLPVYQAAGTLVLWDEPNVWRQAWQQRPKQDGLVPLLLPAGDLPDIAAIGAEQATSGDRQRLAAIAQRYRTNDVIVVYGVLRLDAAVARRRLEVRTSRYGLSGDSQPWSAVFRQDAEETIGGLLARSTAAVAEQVEDEWKRQNLLKFDSLGIAAVTVPVSELKDWLAVRERLREVAVIHRIELILMSRDEVRINLHYIGGPEQLTLAMDQADLTMIKEEDEWVLNPIDLGPGKS